MPLILSGSAGLSGNVGTTTKEMLPAGTVLQVVNTTLAVAVSGIVNKMAVLSTSITPLSTTSKILVLVQCSAYSSASSNAGAFLGVDRDSTTLPAGCVGMIDTANSNVSPLNINYLDSPNTTSAITYTAWLQRNSGGTSAVSVYSNGANDRRAQITLIEIKG